MVLGEQGQPGAEKASADCEDGNKKAHRSVVYPAFTLRRCVDNARLIDAMYGTARIERKVAAELMGYTVGKRGLHGTATKALTSMTAFGLIESAGRGAVRITPQGKRVLIPASEDEKASDLTSLAFRPPLFATIQERFEGAELVPQEGVIAFLNQEDYEPRYIRAAAKSYVDTVSYVREEVGSVATSNGSPRETRSSATTESVGEAKATDADDEVALVLRDTQGRLPAVTIQLTNKGNIVGSRELENLVSMLQAYQPILAAAESASQEG